jgi:hypothetical protein
VFYPTLSNSDIKAHKSNAFMSFYVDDIMIDDIMGGSYFTLALRLCSRQHVHNSQKSSRPHFLYPLYALYYCVVFTTHVHISHQIIVNTAKTSDATVTTFHLSYQSSTIHPSTHSLPHPPSISIKLLPIAIGNRNNE